MTDHRWRIYHADGEPPPPDVLALLGNSGIWLRVGPNRWRCPGGTELEWPEMPPEWGPWVECPDYRLVVEAAETARVRR